ncbi:MAG TPA: hypothetical protein VFO20_12350 [Propionibacteriaceae bacterium]|nr:hypothetical protein [Propionibacteriaceae bacterium]
MTSHELQVRQKRELEQKQEGTVPACSFIPNAHDELHRQPYAAYPARRWMRLA